jgi:hypothetical protein
MTISQPTPDDGDLKMSDLCQSLTRDGKTIEVEIYADGGEGWQVLVADEHSNMTVWTDFFGSEQAALDEVLETIDEEGMDALVDLPAAERYRFPLG